MNYIITYFVPIKNIPSGRIQVYSNAAVFYEYLVEIPHWKWLSESPKKTYIIILQSQCVADPLKMLFSLVFIQLIGLVPKISTLSWRLRLAFSEDKQKKESSESKLEEGVIWVRLYGRN